MLRSSVLVRLARELITYMEEKAAQTLLEGKGGNDGLVDGIAKLAQSSCPAGKYLLPLLRVNRATPK